MIGYVLDGERPQCRRAFPRASFGMIDLGIIALPSRRAENDEKFDRHFLYFFRYGRTPF